MPSSFQVRPFVDTDYPRMVEIATATFPEAPRALDDVRRRDAQWNHACYALLRLVATDETGAVAGWGQYNHQPHQFDPDAYRIGIQVAPERQGQGIGSLLLERLLEALGERGARSVSARAREDLPASVSFLEHRGFMPVEVTRESFLPLTCYDPAPALAAEATLRAQGITVRSLAEEGVDDPDVLARVHALYLACLRDVPTTRPVTTIPYDQFVSREINAPNALPDAHFLAIANGAYIAMCEFVRDPAQPDVLAGRMTGCLPAWRGRGIVTALKLHMARYGHEHGFREIRTWNSAANASMLRINEGIGFRPRWSWITFQRELCDARW